MLRLRARDHDLGLPDWQTHSCPYRDHETTDRLSSLGGAAVNAALRLPSHPQPPGNRPPVESRGRQTARRKQGGRGPVQERPDTMQSPRALTSLLAGSIDRFNAVGLRSVRAADAARSHGKEKRRRALQHPFSQGRI